MKRMSMLPAALLLGLSSVTAWAAPPPKAPPLDPAVLELLGEVKGDPEDLFMLLDSHALRSERLKGPPPAPAAGAAPLAPPSPPPALGGRP